jgi:hypothetical protein
VDTVEVVTVEVDDIDTVLEIQRWRAAGAAREEGAEGAVTQ